MLRAPPRVRWLKWGGTIGGAVTLLAVVYLAGVNLLLGTHALRAAVNGAPDKVLIEYTKAHSFFPGHIHVEGLSIRGKDGNIEWILTIDRCDFELVFRDLLRRQFHAEHVRGDGLTFRVRLRESRPDPAHDAALPPVPGFTDPPLKDIGPDPPPLSDAEYALWSIALGDVSAEHVREFWVDTRSAFGATTASTAGGFSDRCVGAPSGPRPSTCCVSRARTESGRSSPASKGGSA